MYGRTAVYDCLRKTSAARAESLKAVSLWSGDIIFPLSSWSPAGGTDMDDDGDDV